MVVDDEVGGVGEVVEQLGLKQHDRGSNKRIIGGDGLWGCVSSWGG